MFLRRLLNNSDLLLRESLGGRCRRLRQHSSPISSQSLGSSSSSSIDNEYVGGRIKDLRMLVAIGELAARNLPLIMAANMLKPNSGGGGGGDPATADRDDNKSISFEDGDIGIVIEGNGKHEVNDSSSSNSSSSSNDNNNDNSLKYTPTSHYKRDKNLKDSSRDKKIVDILQYITSAKLDDATSNIYDEILVKFRPFSSNQLEDTISKIFFLFQESYHLPYALKLISDIIKSKNIDQIYSYKKVFNAASIALVRCYSKNGEIQNALRVIDVYREQEPNAIRHRLYYPIIEAVKSGGDVYSVLDLIIQSVLCSDQKTFRANHITILLETAAKSKSLRDKQIVATLDKFLSVLSKQLNPLPFSSLIDITAHLNDTTKEAILDSGIFVESVERLESELTSKSLKLLVDERKKGYVIAEDKRLEISDVMGPTASENGIFCDASYMETLSQKFSFRRRPISLLGRGGRPSSTAKIVRLMPAGPQACQCPHCFAKLALTPLTSHERQSIRLSFIKQISGFRSNNFEEFLTFESWLHKRAPINYFLDGCNIGYLTQNHSNGAFNVGQIKSLADHLKSAGGNVCILLPRSYTLGNSYYDVIANKMRYYSSIDRRQILAWIEQDMLYAVPDKIHDDLFCMYATVSTASPPNSMVVTNDLLRNHVYAFETSPIFKKWRENHTAGFTIKVGRDKEGKLSPKEFSVDHHPLSNMQKSSNGYWHIPSLDRDAWLCFKLQQKNVAYKI